MAESLTNASPIWSVEQRDMALLIILGAEWSYSIPLGILTQNEEALLFAWHV